MNLTDRAKQAYEKHEAEESAYRNEKAAEFAAHAADTFTAQMRLEKGSVGFHPVTPRTSTSCALTPAVEARKEYDAVEFYVIVPCPLCGDKGYRHVISLADIGQAIKEGYTECGCVAPSSSADGDNPLERIADALERIAFRLEEEGAYA